MTPEEQSLVRYRFKRAAEALEEARLLFDTGHLHTYVNRLYYACFYAMSALLLAKGLTASKHTQVRALLHKEFVRTDMIPAEQGKFFDLLFNSRQKSDYSDLVVLQADQIKPWYQQAREFVDVVSGLIEA